MVVATPNVRLWPNGQPMYSADGYKNYAALPQPVLTWEKLRDVSTSHATLALPERITMYLFLLLVGPAVF